MLISRRNFFRISVLPAVVSLAPSVSIFGQTGKVSARRPKTLGFKDFRNQIGTTFKLSDGIIASQAVLTEVKNTERSGETQPDTELADSNCFSLTFQLLNTFPVNQATYDVAHGKMGEFQLFMVPGELSQNQPLLIAIINRTN
jgi:hypothetical protein